MEKRAHYKLCLKTFSTKLRELRHVGHMVAFWHDRTAEDISGPIPSLLGSALLSRPFLAHAVPMVNDPNGFQNLAWGATLKVRTDLEATGRPNMNEYQFKNTPPSFADIPVESVRFLSVDDQFARVTIRYQGDDRHKQILAYLEQQFGALSTSPGR